MPLTLADLLQLETDPGWTLVEEGIPGPREPEIESIFTIANGYVGSRASLDEDGPLSKPTTYAAGVFAIDPEAGIPTLVRLPDWSHLAVLVDGRRLSFDTGRVLEHRRTLDLKRGLLWREWRHETADGGITRVIFLRFASLADRHLLVQSVGMTAVERAQAIGVAARTAESTDRVAFATALDAHPSPTNQLQDYGESSTSWQVESEDSVRIDRLVSVCTTRDTPEPRSVAEDLLADARRHDVFVHVQRQVDAWRARWQAADVRIEGDDSAQRALRFAIYRLSSVANPDDEYSSIGARGLTGPAYRGHVFWDTEIYMLPFYLFADPPSARSLLMYRYHTLDAARRKAEANGFKGALYAWESADTGDETTPRTVRGKHGETIQILTGEMEQHISADVAYAAWQYWRATGDDEFMAAAGAEILIETARFWASRARIESDGAAHIRRVIGPDEYHEPVDDNAYTNGMARWNLRRAAEIVDTLQRTRKPEWTQLRRRLALADTEPAEWRRMAEVIVTGFHADSKLFEQFAGFFALDDIDVGWYRRCKKPIDVCLGHDRIQRVQAVKQPDVVALSALLWDEFPRPIHDANFQYYEPRTAHGSSLSPSLSALVAARLGHGAQALELFRLGASIDLADKDGRAANGVHMGALGGLWQAAVFGMAGVRIRDNGIALDPHLPPGWSAIECPVRWRGRRLAVRVTPDPLEIQVDVLDGGELTLGVVDGPSCSAHAGARCSVRRERSTWGAWRADR